MSPRECGNCARPVADGAAVCTTCTTGLRDALMSVPDLLDDLLVTISRQDRLGADGKAGPPDEQPAPRLDVSAALDALVGEITTWARDLSETYGLPIPVPDRLGQDARLHSAAVAADWLAEQVNLIRMHPAALEAHRSLTSAIRGARARTDRRPPMAGLGPCPDCGVELRTEPGATEITCPCGTTHYGPTLRAALLARAEYLLLTATELSTALTSWSGTAVPVGTIRSWRSRRQLWPHSWLHDGHLVMGRPHLRPVEPGSKGDPLPERCCRPLYRVGDATKLLRALGRDPSVGR